MLSYEIKGSEISKVNNEVTSKKFKSYIKNALIEMGYDLYFPLLFYKDKKFLNNPSQISPSKYLKIDNVKGNCKNTGYLILVMLNDQKIILWVNNDNFVFLQLPYIFNDELYNMTIFKCVLDNNCIIIYDIYSYCNDILDPFDNYNRFQLIRNISNDCVFDRDNTYKNIYELVFLEYKEFPYDTNSGIFIPRVTDDKSKVYYR